MLSGVTHSLLKIAVHPCENDPISNNEELGTRTLRKGHQKETGYIKF